MEAERKLRGATYHLHRMEELYLKDEERFIYELEAFLVKARSVPEILLEDFNQKFSLGIGLEKKLTSRAFEKRAEELRNIRAMEFIDWWKNKKNIIRSAPLGAILFKKRDISVHRKVIAPDLVRVTLTANIDVGVSVTVKNEKGDIISELEMPPRSRKPEPPKVEWCFSDFPDESVFEICERLLQIVKEFIKEATNRFN